MLRVESQALLTRRNNEKEKGTYRKIAGPTRSNVLVETTYREKYEGLNREKKRETITTRGGKAIKRGKKKL